MILPTSPNITVQEVSLSDILLEDKILVFDNFYTNLDWLTNQKIQIKKSLSDNEEIIHLYKGFRHSLLKKVSKIIPDALYATDTGWIRKTKYVTEQQPESTIIHMDTPYIVVSVCLSEHQDNSAQIGTEFVRHKEFGFKKVTQSKNTKLFTKFYKNHRFDSEYWSIWERPELKLNRAFIYSGSLLHRMPKILPDLDHPRIMQFFIFRLPSMKLREYHFDI